MCFRGKNKEQGGIKWLQMLSEDGKNRGVFLWQGFRRHSLLSGEWAPVLFTSPLEVNPSVAVSLEFNGEGRVRSLEVWDHYRAVGCDEKSHNWLNNEPAL